LTGAAGTVKGQRNEKKICKQNSGQKKKGDGTFEIEKFEKKGKTMVLVVQIR